MKKIQSIKGMFDIVPDRSGIWQYVEATVSELFGRYGYREIRFPILEQTELFKRGIGEVTDIVEKEMYTFEDRNGSSLTLRPEGTASCVRACEENGLLYNQTQKLWYTGPMFRHENPQKGRQRQFHQFGVEAFGFDGPDVDAELLIMSSRLWAELGLSEVVSLQLNSIGSSAARAAFKADLVAYLNQHVEQLDADSRRRLTTNPLRILDSKSAQTQAIVDGAPSLHDYLDEQSKAHFEGLCSLLDAAGVKYEINPRLVRGLDYYSNTVFEWVTDQLGAQGTVCAGGRYDGLVEQLGGKPTPAIGWGMGIERLILLLEHCEVIPQEATQYTDVYIAAVGDVQQSTMMLAEALRSELPFLRLVTNMGGGSFKNQLKRADRSGAQVALIVGEDEARDKTVSIKPLRTNQEQLTVPVAEVGAMLQQLLS